MHDLKRIIRAGFVNFARNGLLSFASVLVATITLSVITAIIMLQAVLLFSLDVIRSKVDVTIYFVPGAAEEKIFTLRDSLEDLPEVAGVSYVSAEQALEVFKERHANYYSTLAALEEIDENPLGAYLNIKAKEISQYENIADFLESDNALVSGSVSIVDKVNYHQNKLVIGKLESIISGAQRLDFLVILILIFISIVITLNTVRLTIFIARDEIRVMRLVGASKSRIHGPFMIEGAICGVVATVATLLLFWPITAWFGNNMTGFLGIDLYDYYKSNLPQIFIIILFSGILLGVISSWVAVRKYLEK